MPPAAEDLDPKRYGHKRAVRLVNWRVEHDPTSLWLQDRLKATMPGVDADGNPFDCRDEPVLDPAAEARMIDDAVYREDADGRPHYGRIMRALASWYPNEAERFDIDFALMTGELANLLGDLVEALGGEMAEVA